MAKKKIVLVFEFDEVQEYPDEPASLELASVKLGKKTTLTAGERSSVTEAWGQSDTWHVDIHNDILGVIHSGASADYS